MIYLLPGMGATKAMYAGAWDHLPDSCGIDWPQGQSGMALNEVATWLIETYSIEGDDSVVGSSLGGIVALEIHKRVGLRHVFLLGSAVAKEEINPVLLALAPLAKLTPFSFLQFLARQGPTLLSSMFADVDGKFLRSMCVALGHWQGYNGDLSSIFRLHGEKDVVIKCPRDCHAVKDAGHLIAMTHDDACVNFIQSLIEQ